MPFVLVHPLFGPSPFGSPDHVPALAGIPGLLHGSLPSSLLAALDVVGGIEGVTVVVLTVAHLIARFRASHGFERLQLRLFTWSVVGGIAVIVVPWHLLVEAVAPVTVPDWLAWSIGPAVVWGGMAMAVVRHRLYDVDRIVSRTVSWALVTALLVGVYLGGVVVLQAALRPVLGTGDLPVALATLAAAAVARPLLLSVRGLVDRRFNRARYDATLAIERYGRGLRDEVSLDAIVRGLRTTAADTVQPASVGVTVVERRP